MMVIIIFDVLTNFVFTTSETERDYSNKHSTYELPHESLNNLRLRILGKQEISEKSQNFIKSKCSTQPDFQNKNFANNSKNLLKIEIELFLNTLLHLKTRVCLKYFVHHCLCKQFLVSKPPQATSNLICLTILVTLRPVTQFSFKSRATKLKKLKFVLLHNYFSDLFTEVCFWY